MQYGIVKIALKEFGARPRQRVYAVTAELFTLVCVYPYHETFQFALFPSHGTLILQYALTLERLGNAS